MKTDLKFTDVTQRMTRNISTTVKVKRTAHTCGHRVGWFCHSRYLYDMEALYAERAWSKFDTFYRAMDLTNPIQAMRYDQANSEQAKQATQATQAEQAKQDEQAEQATAPAQPTTTEPSVVAGPHLADRVIASSGSQCVDRQAATAATGSNQ